MFGPSLMWGAEAALVGLAAAAVPVTAQVLDAYARGDHARFVQAVTESGGARYVAPEARTSNDLADGGDWAAPAPPDVANIAPPIAAPPRWTKRRRERFDGCSDRSVTVPVDSIARAERTTSESRSSSADDRHDRSTRAPERPPSRRPDSPSRDRLRDVFPSAPRAGSPRRG